EIRNNEIIGEAFLRIGAAYDGINNLNAIENYNNAITYLNKTSNYLLKVSTYLALASIYLDDLNFDKFNNFIFKSSELLQNNPNIFYESKIQYLKLVKLYITEDFFNLKKQLRSVLLKAAQTGSKLRMLYIYRLEALAESITGKTERAVMLLNNAHQFEDKSYNY